jgi:hypothetical protein
VRAKQVEILRFAMPLIFPVAQLQTFAVKNSVGKMAHPITKIQINPAGKLVPYRVV